ncbi:MAG: histidine phosphatase family protein [Anaerolineae bacterium]|nr:histidine phosphatase family protein [Anaerolineae bacterium]
MKTLLIMRHAKSSWKEKDIPDHDRPLKKRGRKSAAVMGKLIKEMELVPEKILSSTAERARKTAEILIEGMNFEGEVEYLPALYMAEPEVIAEILSALPDELERVMVVGHNPGLEGLVQMLCGQVVSLPTATLAYVVIPIKKWEELKGDLKGDLVNIYAATEKV